MDKGKGKCKGCVVHLHIRRHPGAAQCAEGRAQQLHDAVEDGLEPGDL